MDSALKRSLLRAQQYVADQKYDEALRCFDELSLKYRRKTCPVEVLHSRSAIFIKLQRLAEATVDAKSMIQHYPIDGRGYLRLAQILRYEAQRDKNDKALEAAVKVLQSGLKRMPRGSREQAARTQTMRSIVVEIQEQLAAKVMPDPATRLPAEIFLRILEQCSFKDLLRWRRVSRAWRNAIKGAATWRQLYFTDEFCPKTANQIKCLLSLATDSQANCLVHDFRIISRRKHRKEEGQYGAETISRVVIRCCTVLRSAALCFTPYSPWRQLLECVQSSTLSKLEIASYIPEPWDARTEFDFYRRCHDQKITHDDMTFLLSRFPCLTHLHIGSVDPDLRKEIQWPATTSKLRSLKLYYLVVNIDNPLAPTFGYLNLVTLASLAVELEELELAGFREDHEVPPVNWQAFRALRTLRLEIVVPHGIDDMRREGHQLLLPSHLEELCLAQIDRGIPELYYIPLEQIPTLLSLRRLSAHWEFYPAVITILEASGCLIEDLTLREGTRMPSSIHDRWEYSFDAVRLEMIAGKGRFDALRNFHLQTWYRKHAKDPLANALAHNCKALRSVTVSPECGFTGAGIGALCRKDGHDLEFLDVGTCPDANPDAAKFARALGINFRGTLRFAAD